MLLCRTCRGRADELVNEVPTPSKQNETMDSSISGLYPTSVVSVPSDGSTKTLHNIHEIQSLAKHLRLKEPQTGELTTSSSSYNVKVVEELYTNIITKINSMFSCTSIDLNIQDEMIENLKASYETAESSEENITKIMEEC